jgi:hypothetical protein
MTTTLADMRDLFFPCDSFWGCRCALLYLCIPVGRPVNHSFVWAISSWVLGDLSLVAHTWRLQKHLQLAPMIHNRNFVNDVKVLFLFFLATVHRGTIPDHSVRTWLGASSSSRHTIPFWGIVVHYEKCKVYNNRAPWHDRPCIYSFGLVTRALVSML